MVEVHDDQKPGMGDLHCSYLSMSQDRFLALARRSVSPTHQKNRQFCQYILKSKCSIFSYPFIN